MLENTASDADRVSRIKEQLRARTAPASTPSTPSSTSVPTRPELGIIFFSGLSEVGDPYGLLLDVARYVDRTGFKAVWTPERHFTNVGGAYPNPAVLGAALASITTNVRIRAGSVNLPLHDVVRVAEEWALVDNLSDGRVDLAVAPGWHARDFVLNPDGYADRTRLLEKSRLQLDSLWRGRPIERVDPLGEVHQLTSYPRPVQPELPLWLTTSKNPDAWRHAGAMGLNVLSALINFGPVELEKRIAIYRTARRDSGLDPETGTVSLMLHTFVGTDLSDSIRTVRPALTEYLSAFVDQHATSGQDKTAGKAQTLQSLGEDRGDFVDMVFDRYVSTSSLIGDVDRVKHTLERFSAIGVDEIACLVDFGLERETVMKSLQLLAPLIPEKVV